MILNLTHYIELVDYFSIFLVNDMNFIGTTSSQCKNI